MIKFVLIKAVMVCFPSFPLETWNAMDAKCNTATAFLKEDHVCGFFTALGFTGESQILARLFFFLGGVKYGLEATI